MSNTPAELAEILRGSRRTVVLTGAGVSAESGVPTFRDAQTGLWSKYRPEDLATPEAFTRDPELIWRWYESRRANLSTVEPNPGHMALAKLETRLPSLSLVTQNVDGLHQRAGSKAVIEFHGNIHRTVCSARPCEGQWQTGDDREPPVCPECGQFLRPDVVWFGEAIPPPALLAAERALEGCDLFIAVGTSAVVYPAAGLAAAAAGQGATVAEINPEETPLSGSADICLHGPAGELLPLVLAELTKN